jgi:hypothetical protein
VAVDGFDSNQMLQPGSSLRLNSADNVVISVIADVAETSRDKLTILENGVNVSTNLLLIPLSCIVQLLNSSTVESMQKVTSEYQIFHSFIKHFNVPDIRAPVPWIAELYPSRAWGVP